MTRAPLDAATRLAIEWPAEGSTIRSLTPASFILVVSAAREAGEGGTPGTGSTVATTTRPKRRAK